MNRVGRFSSLDWLGGSVANPQSLNRYAYVMSNPVNAVDPLGLDCTIYGPDGTQQPCGGGGGGWGEWGGADWGPEGPWGDGVNYAGGGPGGAGVAACGVDPFCVAQGGVGPFQSPVANGGSWVTTMVAGGELWQYNPSILWTTDNGFDIHYQTDYWSDLGPAGGAASVATNNDSWLWTATKSFFRDFSVFGPKSDPRPSCFGTFLKDSGANFVGVPGIDTVAAAATAHYGVSQSLAQAVPNTRVARGGISPRQWLAADEAARVSNAGKFSLLFNADLAMAQAFFQSELPAALAGECK